LSEVDEIKEFIGYLKMELIVLITVTIVVGALVYIVSQALKH
jgi:hypothetical protein